MKKAAFGIRMHSGWGVAVAIDDKNEIVDRRRIVIVDEDAPGGKMPFHHAENMALPSAEKFLAGYTAECDRQARHELAKAHEDLIARGYRVDVAALVLASGRALPELGQILASHPMIHAAEGELFRGSVRCACQALGLRVIGYRERDLPGHVKAIFARSADNLVSSVNHAGKILGPPWTGDYKAAAFAACLALRECSRELPKASTA